MFILQKYINAWRCVLSPCVNIVTCTGFTRQE
jgi:hypothetical protein